MTADEAQVSPSHRGVRAKGVGSDSVCGRPRRGGQGQLAFGAARKNATTAAAHPPIHLYPKTVGLRSGGKVTSSYTLNPFNSGGCRARRYELTTAKLRRVWEEANCRTISTRHVVRSRNPTNRRKQLSWNDDDDDNDGVATRDSIHGRPVDRIGREKRRKEGEGRTVFRRAQQGRHCYAGT